MSATNRGNKRNKNDFYATPIKTINDLLNHIDLNTYGINVLEPSAGNGNILKTVKNRYPNKTYTAIELRKDETENLKKITNNIQIMDFLKFPENKKYDIIIGNPPYSLAQQFVEKSLNLLSDNGILIFLLRVGFLESKKRFLWWQGKIPNKLYILSNRPSFTGNGTDATCYGWFMWDKNTTKQEIRII